MFIHDAVLESVTCGDTQISATNLRSTIQKMSKVDPVTHKNTFEAEFHVSFPLCMLATLCLLYW